MLNGRQFAKKAIRIINRAVDASVLILLLFLLLFGFYSLWDAQSIYTQADAAQYRIYNPMKEEASGASFEGLKQINPDVFSWLTVYETHIDYPVLQAENNEKYLNTGVDGQYSLSGALFLDYKNARDFTDFNSMIYGHHMDQAVMFGELSDFANKAYFDAHPYGSLYYAGQMKGIEFFAFLEEDAYQSSVYSVPLHDEGQRQVYLENILNQAVQKRDTAVSTQDHLILLSTCTSDFTNGRHILVGILSDDVHPNPWATGDEKEGNTGTGVDGAGGMDLVMRWLLKVPLWLWLLIAALLILLWKNINVKPR